jgi:hypothetical protein
LATGKKFKADEFVRVFSEPFGEDVASLPYVASHHMKQFVTLGVQPKRFTRGSTHLTSGLNT